MVRAHSNGQFDSRGGPALKARSHPRICQGSGDRYDFGLGLPYLDRVAVRLPEERARQG
jgi:hypothetical protein